jgi:nitrilase
LKENDPMPASTSSADTLTVGLAQISPVWLDREKTLSKVIGQVEAAAAEGCRLVGFGEALVPGYPFWIERTDGARFNSPLQKELHSHYLTQAVQIESGHLSDVCATAADHGIAVALGCVERPGDRGGHSLYCSLVFIDARGEIRSVHRKLMPTYEERLTWSPGDGNGLRVHPLGAFTVGCLNCWENWMPMARTALYAQGEDLHVAVWPGGLRNTADITRFIALESRSYVVSVSGMMRTADVPPGTPFRDRIVGESDSVLADGGSCIAGPDGQWVLAPVTDREALLTAVIDHGRVREERQNFDPSGHYARPDVLNLSVRRQRQGVLTFVDDHPCFHGSPFRGEGGGLSCGSLRRNPCGRHTER